jgi:hypothetical protein
MVDRAHIHITRVNRNLASSTRLALKQNTPDRRLSPPARHVIEVPRYHSHESFGRRVSSSLFSIFILIDHCYSVCGYRQQARQEPQLSLNHQATLFLLQTKGFSIMTIIRIRSDLLDSLSFCMIFSEQIKAMLAIWGCPYRPEKHTVRPNLVEEFNALVYCY